MEVLLLLGIGLVAAGFGFSGGSDDDDGDDPLEPTVSGTSDDDNLSGDGNALVRGYGGNDILLLDDDARGTGDRGNDLIEMAGNSQGFGGEGEDELTATGNAQAYGGAGDDNLVGTGTLYGDGGRDLIFAAQGADAYGGNGNDIFNMREDSRATGGAGRDLFAIYAQQALFQAGDPFAEMTVTDFDTGEDRLVISANGPITELTLREEDGDTVIEASYDAAALTGGQSQGAGGVSVRLEGVTGMRIEDVGIGADNVLGAGDRGFFFAPDIRGSGDDDVVLSDAATWLDAGQGDDLVEAGAGSYHAILTGDGNDTIRSSSFGRIVAGDGDDLIEIETPRLVTDDEAPPELLTAGDIVIHGGAGNDTILIADRVPSSGASPVWADGGSGDDTITVDRSVRQGYAVSGGAGSDEITAWSSPGSSIFVGPDDDSVDTVILNVEQPLAPTGSSTSIRLDDDPLDRVEIRVDAGFTGDVRWQIFQPDQDPFFDFTILSVGGVNVAVFQGSGDWQNDPRITIVREGAT
ncbi:MAG: hypothetical protein ACT4OK_01340 [Gemmobacter sp.]